MFLCLRALPLQLGVGERLVKNWGASRSLTLIRTKSSNNLKFATLNLHGTLWLQIMFILLYFSSVRVRGAGKPSCSIPIS